MYIRPSKYLKALRNEFPKFYPQIHIIVEKSTEKLLKQKFSHRHKRSDNNLHRRGTQKVQRKVQKWGLYNCISAVACSKYSIFDLQKGKELNRKPIHKHWSLLFFVHKEKQLSQSNREDHTHTHTLSTPNTNES